MVLGLYGIAKGKQICGEGSKREKGGQTVDENLAKQLMLQELKCKTKHDISLKHQLFLFWKQVIAFSKYLLGICYAITTMLGSVKKAKG